jgi:hypothetical protein
MLRHVVLFRWAPDATDEAKAAVSRALDDLRDQIAVISGYHHGCDAGLAAGNWDYVVVGDFADTAAYVEYRDHSAHRAVIAEHVRPILHERAAVQYVVPDLA